MVKSAIVANSVLVTVLATTFWEALIVELAIILLSKDNATAFVDKSIVAGAIFTLVIVPSRILSASIVLTCTLTPSKDRIMSDVIVVVPVRSLLSIWTYHVTPVHTAVTVNAYSNWLSEIVLPKISKSQPFLTKVGKYLITTLVPILGVPVGSIL